MLSALVVLAAALALLAAVILALRLRLSSAQPTDTLERPQPTDASFIAPSAHRHSSQPTDASGDTDEAATATKGGGRAWRWLHSDCYTTH